MTIGNQVVGDAFSLKDKILTKPLYYGHGRTGRPKAGRPTGQADIARQQAISIIPVWIIGQIKNNDPNYTPTPARRWCR
jgi:hypothetical protein